jgi:lysophospholipase L1-like esterase
VTARGPRERGAAHETAPGPSAPRVGSAGTAPQRRAALELALAGFVALVAVTCATNGRVVPLAATSPVDSVVPPATALAPRAREGAGTAPSAGLASAEPPSPIGAPAPPEGKAVAPWRRALDAFAARSPAQPVRILWLGDSHTAADFWTQVVRTDLQQRYGNGGPGFLRLGVTPYRHGRAKVTVTGRWRRVPSAPSRVVVTDDGVFGIGGIRAEPGSTDARVTAELYSSALRGSARWDVAFRLRAPTAAFEVTVDDAAPVRVDGRDGSGAAIRHLELSGKAGGELSLGRFRGPVELFGVVAEGTEPGVVLDTVGIDGARIATLLAWDEATFVTEVARRKPDFLVLAFGTNEAFAEEDVARYPGQYQRVLGRVRAAAPDVACVLIGPTNVPGRDGRDGRVPAIDRVQAAAAAEQGCAFVSLNELMGGEGSFREWSHATPPLAGPDGVHLLQAGYERLGHAVVDALVGPP